MLKLWILAGLGGSAALVATALLLTPPSAPQKSAYFESRSPAPLERIDLIQAVRDATPPAVGRAAPPLDEPDEVGARFNLQTHCRQQPVLLGAFCTCSRCRKTAKAWEELLQRWTGRFTAAAIVALPKDDPIIRFHDELRLSFPLMPDPQHTLSAQFPGPGEGSEALACPRAWVIGRDGRFRYVMPMASEPTADVLARISAALGLPS